jgi:hypothetical protein
MSKSTTQSRAIAHRNSLIEHMAAKGVPLAQIAYEVGLKNATISNLLRSPESIARVEDINSQIRAQMISEAATIGEQFDEEAPHAFKSLKTLNRGETEDVEYPVPHAVRLQAATQILDRAPSVPSRKGEGGDARHLHIHLPEKQFQNAQQALIDIGVNTVVEEDKSTDEPNKDAK